MTRDEPERSIEVFADVLCPFTHLSLVRLAERRDRAGIRDRIHVKAWPLELVNGAPIASELAAREIAALREQVARDLFRGFDPSTWPGTSLPALALAAAAYRVAPEAGERVSLALRHALFETGRDISDRSVLAGIASAYDVELELCDPHAVIDEWHEGQRRGVEGSPYFFAGEQGFFCPSLDIRHVDGQLSVMPKERERDRFLDAVLGQQRVS